MKILDISRSGCLAESRRRVDIGTVGRLRLKFGTEEYDDDVEVVRCEPMPDVVRGYRLGIRFLWTSPRLEGSIREAVTTEAVAVDHPEQIWLM